MPISLFNKARRSAEQAANKRFISEEMKQRLLKSIDKDESAHHLEGLDRFIKEITPNRNPGRPIPLAGG